MKKLLLASVLTVAVMFAQATGGSTDTKSNKTGTGKTNTKSHSKVVGKKGAKKSKKGSGGQTTPPPK
jgi:hypothetical protein